MTMPPVVYRAFATILPAFLGLGLIHLCIKGQLDLFSAVAAILAIGAATLTAAALFRSEAEARLVRENAPPPMFLHRLDAGR